MFALDVFPDISRLTSSAGEAEVRRADRRKASRRLVHRISSEGGKAFNISFRPVFGVRGPVIA